MTEQVSGVIEQPRELGRWGRIRFSRAVADWLELQSCEVMQHHTDGVRQVERGIDRAAVQAQHPVAKP